MVNNGVYLSGAGITDGWYQVATFVDSDTFDIDRSAGAGASGGSAAIGGAVALPTTALFAAFAQGNTLWQKAGNYTWTALPTLNNGAIALPNTWKGYNSTRGDNPTHASGNRPKNISSARWLQSGRYWYFENLWFSITSTIESILYNGTGNVRYIRCSFDNPQSGAINGVWRNNAKNELSLIDCDLTAPNATDAFNGGILDQSPASGGPGLITGNTVHDAPEGITVDAASDNMEVSFNRIWAITNNGLQLEKDLDVVRNNTINGCGVGIELNTNADRPLIVNNDISDCTTGVNGVASRDYYLDFNNFFGNGTDVVNATKGANTTSNDPEHADAANGDFTNTLSASDAMNPDLNIKQGAVQNADAAPPAYGFIT
jgi:parallel beta-helix repeat protein